MKPHIKEAYRYLDNANDIVNTKLSIDNAHYDDKKYVKLAGHAAYAGVLVALDPFVEGKVKKGRRPDVFVYRDALTKRDKKILQIFNSAYDYLHLLMGYDGNLSIETKKTGFKFAKEIIAWADKNTTATGEAKNYK